MATHPVTKAKRWVRTIIDKVNTIRPHSALAKKTLNKFQPSTQAEILLMAS